MSRNQLPPLDEAVIRARVGDRSFKLGQDYFRNGAIFNARRQGATLKACCEGQSAPYYHVSATLDERGVTRADCSCPVGGGGYCKHVAALLLTWLHQPETFGEVEEVDAALARRSKEELIALIKQMLRRRPELEVLLETPLPTGGRGGAPGTPVDPEIYRRQARAVLRSIDAEHGYHPIASATTELRAMVEIGDGFLEQQDYANAAVVYQALADAVLEQYETFDDEEGALADVVRACAEGLGACLARLPEGDAARAAVLKGLFDIFRADVRLGGRGLSAGVPEALVERTTNAERRTLAAWVRAALPEGSEWSDRWERQVYGDLLLDLEADEVDDEAFLRICRETDRLHDLVDRLLTLGRLDEARQEARRAGVYDLLMLAEVFTHHGHDEVAEQLIEERTTTARDLRLLEWLERRYVGRGNFARALDVAEALFAQQPSLDRYQEVRELARRLGQWNALRPKLLERLAKARQTTVLVQVWLDEGDVDRALDLVRATWREASRYGFASGTAIDLRVAQAAESTRPRDAIEIYRRHVEDIVERRDRPAYEEAAQLLQRMRGLYERLGEQETWERYLADLRERTRTLRAFKAELAAAGL